MRLDAHAVGCRGKVRECVSAADATARYSTILDWTVLYCATADRQTSGAQTDGGSEVRVRAKVHVRDELPP